MRSAMPNGLPQAMIPMVMALRMLMKSPRVDLGNDPEWYKISGATIDALS